MKGILKKIVASVLIWEAKCVLRKYKPNVIAITGSVGKTSTKDVVFDVLSHFEHTRKSEKSFNSELGVPLTVLGLPNAWSSLFGWFENIAEGFFLLLKKHKYPDWLVLEVGVDRPRDVEKLSWLCPNVVIFTFFPDIPVHVEYFKTPDEVTQEKRKLKNALRENGTLVYNIDDPKMAEEEVCDGQHKISYGFSEGAMVRCVEYVIVYEAEKPKGVSFTIQFQEKRISYTYEGVLGKHHVYPFLASVATMVSEGKALEHIAESLRTVHTPAPGRMRLLKGSHNSVIIDDTYNSSPVAVHAGLDTLGELITTGKKVVVLGDMLELGDYSVREHQNVGKKVAEVADIFFAVGVRMGDAVESARGEEKKRCAQIELYQTKEDILTTLREVVGEHDLIFIKGSQGMRMEHITLELLENKNDAQFLPRQDSHWKSIV